MNNAQASLKKSNKAQASLKNSAPPKQKKRRRGASLDKKKARAGWFFVAPFAIGFLLIYLPIIIDSINLSMNTIRTVPGGDYRLIWVGLEHYKTALLKDTAFVQTLTSGLTQLIIDIPAIVIFSLFMAVLLNQKMIGRAAFRAIFFVPVILSTGLIAQIDANNILEQNMNSGEIDNGSQGQSTASQIISAADVTMLFRTMKIGTGLVQYVVDLVNNVYGIINRSGVQMLIFLAGLQSISPAIYESCSIDGATAWETFWKITFPMISPMILVNTIYTVIDSFTSQSNTVMNYIQEYYKSSNEVSTAMAWIYFVIVIAIVAVVSGILSAYIFYQRRD